jgi:hypothetical protein
MPKPMTRASGRECSFRAIHPISSPATSPFPMDPITIPTI